MEPRKVWLKTGDDLNVDAKPFEVFDIPSNTDELVKIIELSLKFIDEMTSLPLIAQGEQGAHITQTAGGMSMLMNSANVIFRDVVKNWDDDMTTPMIRRFYDWNMQFNSKEEIKGDMQVEARGTSALLVRELQSANLMMMTERWSSHPVLSLALKVYDTMRMTVQSISINPDDVLGTRDEFEAKLKAQAENAPQDPRIAAAQIDAQSRKEQNAANIEIANLRLQASIADVQARTGETREKIAADLREARRQDPAQGADEGGRHRRRGQSRRRGSRRRASRPMRPPAGSRLMEHANPSGRTSSSATANEEIERLHKLLEAIQPEAPPTSCAAKSGRFAACSSSASPRHPSRPSA
jgi:hypothetical protein